MNRVRPFWHNPPPPYTPPDSLWGGVTRENGPKRRETANARRWGYFTVDVARVILAFAGTAATIWLIAFVIAHAVLTAWRWVVILC